MMRHKSIPLLLFGAMFLVLAVSAMWAKAASDITVVESVGQVEVKSPQVSIWKGVTTGVVLLPGEAIRTGPKSKAVIQFQAGTIRLYENTILEIPSQPQQLPVSKDSGGLKSVFLKKGRSLFQVIKDRLQGDFEVTTPSLIAGVKGTAFRVTEEERLKGVTVFEGIVQVTNRQRPEETFDVLANHFTILLGEHLAQPQEFQGESNPLLEDKARNSLLETQSQELMDQTRSEERLTDLLEGNKELQTEVISSSIRIDSSLNTTSTLNSSTELTKETLSSSSSTTDSTTGTLTRVVDDTTGTPNNTLNETTSTVGGVVNDTQSALDSTTGTLTGLTDTILSLP